MMERLKSAVGRSPALRLLCAAVPLILAICLVCGMYLTRYNVAGDEESLAAAASSFTGSEKHILKLIEIPENTKEEDFGIYGVADHPLTDGFLVAIVESEVEGEYQWTGPVLFEKGLNGKYHVMESHVTTHPWAMEMEPLNDSSMGLFGGGDGGRAVAVFWSDVYPEETEYFELTYYDPEAYFAGGTIQQETLRIDVPGDGSLYAEAVSIPFNLYDRDPVAYDADGKVLDLHSYNAAANNAQSNGISGDDGMNLDLYGCILLAGLGLGLWIWRKTI